MKEMILSGMNFFLAFLGFLSIIGIFIGTPAGIIFLVSGLSQKDKKIKQQNIKRAILLIVVPPTVIIFVMFTFALLNTVVGISGNLAHGG